MVRSEIKIVLLIFSFIIFSCKDSSRDKKDNVHIIKIALDSPIEQKSFMDKVSDFRFIPLETTLQSIINKIDKCVIKDERFYILDKKQQSIFIFTNEGKFITRFNRLGKGPDEYIELTDFEIGDQGELLVFDAVNRKLLSYNREFDITGNTRVCYGDKMLLLNDGTVIIYADAPEKKEYAINVFDKNGSIQQTFLQTSDDEGIRPAYSREKNLDYQNGSISLVRSFDYNVYEIKNDSLDIKYRFDFGKENMPEGLLKGSYVEVFQNVLKDESVQMLDNYIETNDWITFEVNGKGIFYEKKKNRYYIPANGLEVPYAPIFQNAPKVINSGKYYTVISAKNVISSLSPLLSYKPYLQKYPILQYLQGFSLNEDDNDILVEYHLND